MRKTMNIPDRMHDWYENKANELNIPTSAIMIMALNEYMKQDDAIKTMPNIIDEMKKLQDMKNELLKE